MADDERRSAGRFDIQIFIQGEPLSGVSRDLSVQGLYVTTDDRPAVGTEAEIRFVWDADEFINAARIIRHGDDGVALEFVSLEPGARAAIEDMRADVSG